MLISRIKYIILIKNLKLCFNKKVLLRERKRHTARRVARARYAALMVGGGRGSTYPDLGFVGYPWVPSPPHPDLGPHLDGGGGIQATPHPDLGWWYPPSNLG